MKLFCRIHYDNVSCFFKQNDDVVLKNIKIKIEHKNDVKIANVDYYYFFVGIEILLNYTNIVF